MTWIIFYDILRLYIYKKIIQWVINYVWKENCLVIYIKISQKNRYKLSKLWNKAESINLEQFKNSNIEHERLIATEFKTSLLYAAGTLITLANPEFLVLGGGIVEKNLDLVDYLKEYLPLYALAPSLKTLHVELSQLKNAPLLGAKLLEKMHYE